MTPQDHDLAHALRMRFRLAGHEPTQTQLDSIKSELKEKGKPTDAEWSAAVNKYCRTVGEGLYKGIDNSDLNALYALAMQQLKK